MEDLYVILGISKTASQDEIQRAYRNKAKQSHPDVGGNSEDFQEINYAYQILSDPNKRAQYDKTGYVGAEENDLVRDAQALIKTKINEFLKEQDESFEKDLVSKFIKQCEDDRSDYKQQIIDLEKHKRFLKKARKRFKKKGKISSDPIRDLFHDNFDRINTAINERLSYIEILDCAINIISDYEFEIIKYLENNEN